MLLSYKFNNFCSFDENAEFELLAPSNKVKNRFPDNYVVTDAGYDVLKVAVVIGENAGGLFALLPMKFRNSNNVPKAVQYIYNP